jgi:hypothetical protein
MPNRRNTEVASVAERDRNSRSFPGTQRFRRERTLMMRICALVTAALWLLGTGSLQAEEEPAAPPAPNSGPPCCQGTAPGGSRHPLLDRLTPGLGCAKPRCAAPRHCLVEWLTYRPQSCGGSCGWGQKAVPCCNPPLYTFFVYDCVGCGHAGCRSAKADGGDHGCRRQPLLGFLHGRSCGQKNCQPCEQGSDDRCKDTSSCAGSCWDRLSFFRCLRSRPCSEGSCSQ